MDIRILLINPPVYDFAAYDFWLKPYGLLSVAGFLRGRADFKLFDYMDRLHPFYASQKDLKHDTWDRGQFYAKKIAVPSFLEKIPRYFQRFGLPQKMFQDVLASEKPFDYIFVQTMMTYWYPGVREIIDDIRKLQGDAKIILGGNYVTLCQEHAGKMGADLIIHGSQLNPLWDYLNIQPDFLQPALWEVYDKLNVGVLKLTQGFPFSCTYCSVPKVYGKFQVRPIERSLAELDMLLGRGIKNIAFYDDAILFNAEQGLVPFLNAVLKRNAKVNLHTPNALNARFITKELAELMVRAGFKTFYLGFESVSENRQQNTGSKVFPNELADAVKYLKAAGALPENITAYQILGHLHCSTHELETSMRFVSSLGIRGMLADFSPIPSTPDGDEAAKLVDMNEPLMHNKTAFPILLLGNNKVNYLKNLQRQLNRTLK